MGAGGVGWAVNPPWGAGASGGGGRPLLLTSCVLFALFTYPLFMLMNTGSVALAVVAHVTLAVFEALFVCTSLAAGA